MNKTYFINNEIWMLSLMGAFQRANVYRVDATELKKKHFKGMLKDHFDNILQTKYSKAVSETEHIENIKEVIRLSECSKDLLTNGKLNFGVAQKLLNLYLKYNWCVDKIPTPPHFPVDSIIQKRLGLKVIAWTKMKDEEEYLKIINYAKTQLCKHDCKTIAELELLLFSRNQ
ncbi:hypothetical protein ACJRPK_11325 [Aquimarina sp. 2-A2]|uniref:hypothetical protein n=1 Tax=Aquimarina sp. 2-A2 TaxID=3382644 RepID=UPI00387F07A5